MIFPTFKDALAAIEDKADFSDIFGKVLSSSYSVYIRLGEDQKFTGTFAPDYDNYITVDVNGYELKLNSDWIKYTTTNDDIVIKVTNDNDEKDGKLTYIDKELSVVVEESDSFSFEEGVLAGLYNITVKSGITNGTVKADKGLVAHGDKVVFTITPNTGYEISEVKVNNKSVLTATAYEVNSKGVAQYTLKDVDKDAEITATFKKTTTTEEKKEETTTSTWTNPFTDVSKTAQYYEAVEFVCSYEPEALFNGMTATKFEPMTTMTRAMFVTVLGRLAGVNPQQYSGTSFTDVSKNDQQISWAAPYIEWAVQKGITQGTGNGKFSPNDPITHQQMYLFMYRYAMYIENINNSVAAANLSSIRDASEIADWAKDGVKFASMNNILITSGGKLTPTDNALRCELAMLLHGFCTKVLGYGVGR